MNAQLREQKYAKTIQTGLRVAGFYKGRIDGDFGRKSQSANLLLKEHLVSLGYDITDFTGDYTIDEIVAIKQFQALNGLTQDGLFGSHTAEAMFPRIPNREYEDDIIMDSNSKAYDRVNDIAYPKDNQQSLIAYYGDPDDPNFVSDNLSRMKFPYKMKLAWDTSKSVSSSLVHKKCKASFEGAFEEIATEYSANEIEILGLNLFGGLYNKRKIRGGSRWSTHSFGIAIDLDPAHNGLRTPFRQARFSQEEYKLFMEIMDKYGLYSLGRYRDFDCMHFQCAHR